MRSIDPLTAAGTKKKRIKIAKNVMHFRAEMHKNGFAVGALPLQIPPGELTAVRQCTAGAVGLE